MTKLSIFILTLMAVYVNSQQNVGGYLQEDFYWENIKMDLLTFRINGHEDILTENAEISANKNELVKGLVMKIMNAKYLPVKVDEKFPNLLAYQAFNCGVKKISYQNFQNLTELQLLSLTDNKFSSIPFDTFKDLANLKYLHLSYNQLETIEAAHFSNLQNLQTLDLNNNKISSIPNDAFGSLTELRSISLAGNLLRSMNAEHFKHNNKLEWISFYENKIELLNSSMFDYIDRLKTVDLRDNKCINIYYSAGMNYANFKNLIESQCK